MRKLLIVPAILAMTCSAFAQGVRVPVAISGGTQANGSNSIAVLSPNVGANANLTGQLSLLNFGGSGNQTSSPQQVNQGSVGIGGNNAAISR